MPPRLARRVAARFIPNQRFPQLLFVLAHACTLASDNLAHYPLLVHHRTKNTVLCRDHRVVMPSRITSTLVKAKRPVHGVSLFEYLEQQKSQSDRVVLADDVRGRRRRRSDRFSRDPSSAHGESGYLRGGKEKHHTNQMLRRLQIN